MPIRVNPIPRPILPKYHESSHLRSGRDEDASSRQWIKGQDVSAQLAWITEAVRRIQDQINRLRLRKGGDDEGGASPPCPYA